MVLYKGADIVQLKRIYIADYYDCVRIAHGDAGYLELSVFNFQRVVDNGPGAGSYEF